ncbi:MAG: sodium:solute symporter family protein [Candidatus Marinimicrobia bacterium]|nr:sodium:solute symporter family protein [Candidatus Neomarinimicrobiota bacterium]
MDQVIIIIYLIGILALGIFAGKGIKNINQFSVAGRSFGAWIIFATLSASFIGGGFSLGNAEKVFLFGIVNIFALWGFSLKEILVSQFIAPKMYKYPEAISVGDIMFKNYGKTAKILTGIFSVILCAGILGAQVGAIGYIFNIFLKIPQIYGILIGCGIVIIYSTIGGMRAVVFTDIVQFIVLAIGIPLTLIFGIHHAGGWSTISSTVPVTHFTFLGTQKTLLQFIVLFLSFLFGETLVPPYVQRLFLAKDYTHTVKGTLWSGIFSFPFFAITGLIGIVALSLKPDLNPNLSMPFVINEVLPVGLKGIVIAGMISIVMSSADSFLNAASVAFIHDIITPLKKQEMSSNQKLLAVRIITIFVGVFAIVFAIKIKSILDILLYSYNFWSPVILVPLVSAIIGLKTNKKQFFIGAIAGIAGVIIWSFVLKKPLGIDGLIIGLSCNFFAFFTAYFINKK